MGHAELSKKTWTNMRGDSLDADDYGRINRERLEAEAAVPAGTRARQAADRLEDETRGDMRAALGVVAGCQTQPTAAEFRRLGRRLRTARESALTLAKALPDDDHRRNWRGEFVPLLDEAIEAAARGWRRAVRSAGRRSSTSSAGRPSSAPSESYCTCGHGPDAHSGPNHDGPCSQAIRQVQGFAGEGDVTLSCKCRGRVRPTVEQEAITIG